MKAPGRAHRLVRAHGKALALSGKRSSPAPRPEVGTPPGTSAALWLSPSSARSGISPCVEKAPQKENRLHHDKRLTPYRKPWFRAKSSWPRRASIPNSIEPLSTRRNQSSRPIRRTPMHKESGSKCEGSCRSSMSRWAKHAPPSGKAVPRMPQRHWHGCSPSTLRIPSRPSSRRSSTATSEAKQRPLAPR